MTTAVEAPRTDRRALTVVHSAPTWLPRTQTWMHSQCLHLPANVENHVVCERTENLDQFAVANLHSLDAGPRWRLWLDKLTRGFGWRHYLGHLPRVVREISADVVHSHFGHIGWLDRAGVRDGGARHVVTFYGQDASYLPVHQPVWRARYRELFTTVDRVLCEGSHMAATIASLGCPSSKVTVQHLGVELDRFDFLARRWQPGSPLRVLLAGSFTEKKGMPDAIDALGRVRDRNPLEVAIVGDANAEPRNVAEKGRILAAIERNRLTANTRLLGYCSHDELMAEAYGHHVFLSPSVTASDGDTEGGAPVTILEMAATGMPVVSTRHCDIPEVVPTALLAEEHDVDGLAAHLTRLIEAPDCWTGLAESARAHLEAEYDAVKQGEALATIYAEVVDGGR